MDDLFEGLDIKKVEDVKKEKLDKKDNKEENQKDYEYPFRIYLAASYPDVDHIFEENTKYTEKEITKAMLDHGFYEFAGNVTYDFRESENTLIPIFQQHKKG